MRVEPYNWEAKILPTNIQFWIKLPAMTEQYIIFSHVSSVWSVTPHGKIAESKVAQLQTGLKLSAITPINKKSKKTPKPHLFSQLDFGKLKIYLGYVQSQFESLIVLSTPIWLDCDTFTDKTYRIEAVTRSRNRRTYLMIETRIFALLGHVLLAL